MYTNTDYNIYMAQSPCFLSPLADPFCSPFWSPLLTWNPPSCDRIRPPWSQVACKLTSPFPTLSPIPPHCQIPRTQVIKRLTMTTSRIRLLLSGTTTPMSLFLKSAPSRTDIYNYVFILGAVSTDANTYSPLWTNTNWLYCLFNVKYKPCKFEKCMYIYTRI